MKKRFAASAMILAMSAATVLSPLTTFAEAEEQELNIAIFQGGYGDAYWNQMVELFEESHEGVKVNMTISPTIGDIIRPQIVAGNVPDFICLNDGGEDGVILSLIKEHALLNRTMFLMAKTMQEPVHSVMISQMESLQVANVPHMEMGISISHRSTAVHRA